MTEARDLYTRWPKLEQEEKRKIIETVTEKIVIGKDEVDIHLCYLPNASEIMARRQRDLKVALISRHLPSRDTRDKDAGI